MKQHRRETNDVLANLHRRFAKLDRTNPVQAKKERADLDKLLSNELTIERNMMCKNCKWFSKHLGEIEILHDTQQLKRTFTCTECHLPAHVDYIQSPTVMALRILTK